MTSLGTYGLEIDGHFWEDDLEKMAWCKPRSELLDEAVQLWMIHGSSASLAAASVRYGLSLLALTLQAARGLDFPVVVLQEGQSAVEPASLPTPLAGCSVLKAAEAYGAKTVARLHRPVARTFPPYRLDVYGVPQVGQWFEVGPRDQTWQGAIFATSAEGISLHAVGKAGQLPERCTLNYPQKGLRLMIGSREFDGWAVQNELDSQSSYFVKVDSRPESILFCPYATDDQTQAFIIELQ